MLTNQSRIDGVRRVHEWSETSRKEDLLETFAKERKICDCTKPPETLAQNGPFAIFGLFSVSKQNLTNYLAILDYGANPLISHGTYTDSGLGSPMLSARKFFKYLAFAGSFGREARNSAEIGELRPVPRWSNHNV